MATRPIEKICLLMNLVAMACASTNASSPPQVDLGYAIHEASVIQTNTTSFYNFSNIRYAAPPLGQLRFTAPAPPLDNRSAGIQDGSYGNICPQTMTFWQVGQAALAPPSSVESEDCLFLDVFVPASLFPSMKRGMPAPVMVWFHGGGYALGSKISNGSPIGLLQTSFEGGGEGAIYVAMNYRLAAFGWLAGPTLQSNGTANAGFYDQRLALEWVQTHIHLFGGDPGRVTAFGESAGGGSILHQITAYGGAQGSNSTPFQQALMQSPAFIPSPGHYTHETIFQAFLKNANVSTLQAARQLPSSILLAANKATQATAFYGTFNFGPSPDGSFVPDLPGNLLLQGSYDHQLVVLAAHNSNEGNRYTDPKATNDTAFTEYMQLYFPQANPAVISYLSETLYPPIYNGSLPYTTPFGRLDLAISEFTFTCNTNFLARAFNNQTHNYLFSIPPGNHTEDVPYTYFDGPNAAVLNDTVATTLQSYITTFVSTGDPNRAGLPTFPIYGSQATVLNLNQTFIDEITDPVANPRCLWWQKALYF